MNRGNFPDDLPQHRPISGGSPFEGGSGTPFVTSDMPNATSEIYDDILGCGWAIPVGVDGRGRIAMARREQDVEQAIRIILLTGRGQRIFRPEFGSRLNELLFRPNDAMTAGLAASYVREALEQWEPRIEVVNVDAGQDPEATERLLIVIEYEIRATHDRRSLVYPFYRIPPE